MASEMPQDSISEGQNRVPAGDKMDDGVVVVVESGELESAKTGINSQVLPKPGPDSGQVVDDQTAISSDEKDELIKVALTAEQSAEREATANVNDEAEAEGLRMEVCDNVATVEKKTSKDSIDNENATEIGANLGSNDNGGSSNYDFVSTNPDPETNTAEGKLAISSSVQGNDPVNIQAASADGSESENVEGKNLEVVVMSEMEDTVKNDIYEENTEQIESEMKVDNTRGQEFVCEECGKKFTHISSKKRHMLKHREGESPVVYQCLACSKTFQYNSSLKRHLKLHSEETSGKAYTCKECSKAFMYATSLKRHLKTHSGKEIYPCPHCQRCFEYISSLKRHSKLHTEGKGFKCDICSKSFGYLSSLTRHQRVHQKSLTCTKCNKEFRLYKSYVKHLEQHGEILGEAELAAMQVEESDVGEDDVDDETEEEIKASDGGRGGKDDDVPMDENEVSASMVATNMEDSSDKNQLDAIQGDLIDLQSPENHPFVKFVVSQNTVTLEQLQSFQAAQAAGSTEGGEGQDSVAYAVVHTDGNTVIGENSIVSSDMNELTGTPVGGIVLVEFDQNNKVTERHMEGLQASNLLQLLQAVEGFAVENNAQAEAQTSQQQEVAQSEVENEIVEKQSEHNKEVKKAVVEINTDKEQMEDA